MKKTNWKSSFQADGPSFGHKMDDCILIVNILKITFELINDLEIRMCRFENILRQFVKYLS